MGWLTAVSTTLTTEQHTSKSVDENRTTYRYLKKSVAQNCCTAEVISKGRGRAEYGTDFGNSDLLLLGQDGVAFACRGWRRPSSCTDAPKLAVPELLCSAARAPLQSATELLGGTQGGGRRWAARQGGWQRWAAPELLSRRHVGRWRRRGVWTRAAWNLCTGLGFEY
jgi:hypothetical protein